MSPEKIKWYAQDIDIVKTKFGVDENGLPSEQAQAKLKEYGPQ